MSPATSNTRRKARTVILQALYESDCTCHDLDEIVARLSNEESLNEATHGFVHEFTAGVLQNRDGIDILIHRFAPTFPVSQLSIIDRVILRMAVFELMFWNKTSGKVAINEAVELAKLFGSSNSAKFINGVLGSLYSVMIHE